MYSTSISHKQNLNTRSAVSGDVSKSLYWKMLGRLREEDFFLGTPVRFSFLCKNLFAPWKKVSGDHLLDPSFSVIIFLENIR